MLRQLQSGSALQGRLEEGRDFPGDLVSGIQLLAQVAQEAQQVFALRLLDPGQAEFLHEGAQHPTQPHRLQGQYQLPSDAVAQPIDHGPQLYFARLSIIVQRQEAAQ